MRVSHTTAEDSLLGHEAVSIGVHRSFGGYLWFLLLRAGLTFCSDQPEDECGKFPLKLHFQSTKPYFPGSNLHVVSDFEQHDTCSRVRFSTTDISRINEHQHQR